MNEVEHLVISSTIDFSTDYICREMMERGLSYLRLNRDQFSDYRISYDLDNGDLIVADDEQEYAITHDVLKSVYFRAPVFIRSNRPYSVRRQLYRSQWSAFIRNLMVFEGARWMNDPGKTYVAESKALQLREAKAVGLAIPRTWVANCAPTDLDASFLYAVKALDTPLFYDGQLETFTHTLVMSGEEVRRASLEDAPVIVQECLTGKTDLRVTVVGSRLFAASILHHGYGIEGDWRKVTKEELTYVPTDLPKDVSARILALMRRLGLLFGGVDLAVIDDEYYFIEVNPTGEWGWLVSTAGFPIHQAIVDCMEGCVEKAG